MNRGLLHGIADHDKKLSQIKNSDYEFTILRRFPFHTGATQQSVLHQHEQAVRYLFENVPEQYHLAVLGRFNRKLVKRMHQLRNKGF